MLATLAPSSRLVARTYKGAPPNGWSSVGYSGITVSYPPEWPQFPDGTSCPGVPPARVTLIDVTGIGCGSGGQPDTGPTRDGLRIGRAQPWLRNTEPAGVEQTTISNGSTSMLLQPGPDDRTLTVVVQLNATNGVPVEIGLGLDGPLTSPPLSEAPLLSFDTENHWARDLPTSATRHRDHLHVRDATQRGERFGRATDVEATGRAQGLRG